MRRSTNGRTATASRWMNPAATAAARPMPIAQGNSARVGEPVGGRLGMASENVPAPVQELRPTKIRAPTPAASRPGMSTMSSIAPPRPAASMSRKAAAIGLPNRVEMAAKLPALATTALRAARPPCGGRARQASPPPSAISGASGPSTDAQGEGGQRRQRDARDVAHRGMTAGVEAVGRRVATVAGEPRDGKRRQDARDGQQRKRPPDRHRVESQVAGEVGEELRLQAIDQPQESPGGDGDRRAEDGRQGEQAQVGGRSDDRQQGRPARPLPGVSGRPTSQSTAAASGGCAGRCSAIPALIRPSSIARRRAAVREVTPSLR